MAMHYDILLLGDYFFDMIYTGLEHMPVLGQETYTKDLTATGGAMFNTAVALRRLGANIGWATHFGNDYYSQYIRSLAVAENVDLSVAKNLDHPYRRVTTALALHGERAFVTFIDPDEHDMHSYWLETMNRCTTNHLHLGGLMPPHEVLPLVEKAHSLGATVSMDCQDVPMLKESRAWHEIVSTTDIFMPNAREALLLTGAADVQTALRQLGTWCDGKLVVIKDGANGAWAIHNSEVFHAAALSVAEVVDTTGAGDCFNAGFLHAYVVEHQPIDVCLRYGNICGGCSVQGIGGATKAPTYAQLQTALGQ
ncbi:MAG: carbohydrate kinase family protein [Chloroflexota bacterium]